MTEHNWVELYDAFSSQLPYKKGQEHIASFFSNVSNKGIAFLFTCLLIRAMQELANVIAYVDGRPD